ncbi:sporulation transcription factor Spo0A, partial [Mediterraneibacter glycyrrhizinilyticus]
MEHLRVAIADDNQKILDVLDEIISTDKELDLVGKAKNGEEMCQIIKDRKPDVVLLDLIMPKMDGMTVMEKVGQDSSVGKRPYFIVITAVGQEKITEDAFNKGANYYVMKPFNNNMLLERIKSVRNLSRNPERKNDDNTTESAVKTENLENRVTNMLHEIGIPAHIKGYHYLRDAIIMAVNDMDVLNAITKI